MRHEYEELFSRVQEIVNPFCCLFELQLRGNLLQNLDFDKGFRLFCTLDFFLGFIQIVAEVGNQVVLGFLVNLHGFRRKFEDDLGTPLIGQVFQDGFLVAADIAGVAELCV